LSQRSDSELIAYLGEQVRFLENSAAAFDDGFESEAKRLATTMRVLLHDTVQSHSVLEQLGVKTQIAYRDTADPINPRNLMDTPGLVIMELKSGGGSYVPPLDHLVSPSRLKPPVDFRTWWFGDVSKFRGMTLTRDNFVLVAANKEGGAHVDRRLDKRYERFLEVAKDWVYVETDADDKVVSETPFERDLFLASVRQIAHEVLTTFDEQLDLSASDRSALLKHGRPVLIPHGTGGTIPARAVAA
jgi:hypothetical protein